MAKYKVGDRVVIVNCFSEGDCAVYNMEKFLGKTVTISRVSEIDNKYWLEEDHENYFWLESTIARRAGIITLAEFFAERKVCAINCETEDEARALLTVFHKAGKTWCTGQPYNVDRTKWNDYKEKTYYTNNGMYGNSDYATTATKIYKFSDVDIGITPVPKDTMMGLLKNRCEWVALKYNKQKARLENVNGFQVYESNYFAIKNDIRNKFVRCRGCGEIIDNTPESIEEHSKKMLNCLKCKNLIEVAQESLNKEYEKSPDDTYIRSDRSIVKLYCGPSWNKVNISSEKIEHRCVYRACKEKGVESSAGFFAKYPDAFKTLVTVDALDDTWTFNSKAGSDLVYKFGGKQRLWAMANAKGVLYRFELNYYDATYYFMYSNTYSKIIWDINGEWRDEKPSDMSDRMASTVEKVIKKLYEENEA